MANIVQQLRVFSVDIDGDPYPGTVEQFMPPDLQIDARPYRAGSMDTDIMLDFGMEALIANVVLNGYHLQAYSQFGLGNQNRANMVIRGALANTVATDTGTVAAGSNITFTLTGNVIKIEQSRIQGRGDIPKIALMMALHYYKIVIAEIDVVEIDIMKSTRIIAGEDQLKHFRDLIGI